MDQIESVAAYVPYMTAVGNHERGYNFSNYRNRFSMPKKGGDGEGLWYRWVNALSVTSDTVLVTSYTVLVTSYTVLVVGNTVLVISYTVLVVGNTVLFTSYTVLVTS